MSAATPARTESDVWNAWNAQGREKQLDDLSDRYSREILRWLGALGRRDLNILEVGCGAGWMCERMAPYGRVTGIDHADEVIARAKARMPNIVFAAGDFLAMDFPDASFDAIVNIEVLSHVADQPAFMAKIARLLKPGGMMMMATQNRPVLERNKVPPADGWIRDWVSRDELRALAAPHFAIREMFTVVPRAKEGPMRLFASYKLQALLNPLTGNGYRGLLERLGHGWSIMCLAQKPA